MAKSKYKIKWTRPELASLPDAESKAVWMLLVSAVDGLIDADFLVIDDFVLDISPCAIELLSSAVVLRNERR